MADFRQNNMMSRNGYTQRNSCPDYRSGMNSQRRAYTKPEPSYSYDESDSYERTKESKVAMAYVPWQRWKKTYELEEAFQAGTIFPELDKKFHCSGGGCR